MSILDFIPPGWFILGAFLVGYVLGGFITHHLDMWSRK